MSAVSAPVVLTAGEVDRLDRCESIIARGLGTFVEVGEALLEIREDRLYRAHGTFEDYCRERWGLSRARGYELMHAAEAASAVSAIADIPNEAVARELRPVMREDSTEAVEEVWAEVVEEHGPKPTAAQTREVVARRAEQGHQEPEEVPTVAAEPAAWTQRQIDVSDANRARVASTLSRLEGLSAGLADFDPERTAATGNADERAQWARLVTDAISNLRRFRAAVTEGA